MNWKICLIWVLVTMDLNKIFSSRINCLLNLNPIILDSPHKLESGKKVIADLFFTSLILIAELCTIEVEIGIASLFCKVD